MTPQLKNLNGITVYVYGDEHLPPHFHASYGDFNVLIEIRTGLIIRGNFPNNKYHTLMDWLNEEGVKEHLEQYFYERNPRFKPKDKLP